MMNQQDNRSELQKRIAAELADKDKKKKARKDERPDGVDDSAYLQNTKKTTSLAWVWLLIAFFAFIALFGYFLIASNQG